MKAAVVRAFGTPPRYEDFGLPEVGPGQVVVDVLATAVHPRTRSGAQGTHYTSNGQLPLVPGVDGVGTLDSGERVYFLGADDTVGTMAERAVAERQHCVPLPEGVSPAVVAAAMIPALSSWVALTSRVTLRQGQSVLVLGATGAAGRMAVQVARKLGAGRIVAAGRASSDVHSVRALGAHEVVPMTGGPEDAHAIARAASEVDIVLDYLWGSVTQAVLPRMLQQREDEERALSWVEIGSMAGDEVALSSVFLRKRNLHLLGSGQGSARMEDMLRAVPEIARALETRELSIDIRSAPLSEVETLWNAKLAPAQRLVFAR